MSDWWQADPVADAPTPSAGRSPTRIEVRPIDPRARDLAIRTIYGEAAQEPPEGQAAVAAVIRNRLESGRYGDSVPRVVLARNQFEPWNTQEGRSRMFSLTPDSPRYQAIGDIVDRVFRGEMDDPTQGATHFYSPTAQAALGRRPPGWAAGQEPLNIGRHAFYAPEGRVGATDVSARARLADDPAARSPTTVSMAPDSAPTPKPGEGWWSADPVAEAPREQQGPPAPTSVSAPAKEDIGRVRAAVAGGTAGLTFNFGDELAGLRAAGQEVIPDAIRQAGPVTSAVASPLVGLARLGIEYLRGQGEGSKAYETGRDASREELKTAREQYPGTTFAAELAGGSVVPGGAALKGGTVAQRIYQGAKVGGATGAAYGVGGGETADERVTGGLIGGGAGLIAGGALSGALGQRAAAAVPGATGREVVESAERIGVTLPRGIASDRPAVQALTQSTRQLPLIGGYVDKAVTKAGEGLKEATETGAQMIGGTPGTRSDIGAAARASLERGIERLDQASDSVFKTLRGAINADAPVQLPAPLLSRLDDIVQSRIAAGKTGYPIEGLQDAFELLTRPGGATFNGLQRARTELGKAIKWDGRNGGFMQGDLKRAYDVLSDAMEGAVRATAKGSPDDAVKLFHRANETFGKVAGETRELSRFLSQGSDERIVDRIFSYASEKAGKGDIAKLALLRKSMDQSEWNQVSALMLQRMGLNNAGDFSPAFFVRNYETMGNAAKEMIFGKAGTNTRQWTDDVFNVARRMRDAGQAQNFSNTGRAVLTGAGLTGAAYSFSDPIGAAGDALKLAGVGVPVVALLARPASAASMARWSRAYEQLLQKPTNAALASFNVASRNLGNTISDAFGVKVPAESFLRVLQAPGVGRADEDQQQVPR